jgi:hypothetical protein
MQKIVLLKLKHVWSRKELSQANLVISEIKNETIATKKVLLKSDAFDAKKDLKIVLNEH